MVLFSTFWSEGMAPPMRGEQDGRGMTRDISMTFWFQQIGMFVCFINDFIEQWQFLRLYPRIHVDDKIHKKITK